MTRSELIVALLDMPASEGEIELICPGAEGRLQYFTIDTYPIHDDCTTSAERAHPVIWLKPKDYY